jgi:hypothetical protein
MTTARCHQTIGLLPMLGSAAHSQQDLPYTAYTDFSQVLKGNDARDLSVRRVSDP